MSTGWWQRTPAMRWADAGGNEITPRESIARATYLPALDEPHERDGGDTANVPVADLTGGKAWMRDDDEPGSCGAV